MSHIYTVYQVTNTVHGHGIDVRYFMFGRSALQASQKNASIKEALLLLNSKSKHHDLIIVKRKLFTEYGTNKMSKSTDFEALDKHGKNMNKVVKDVISDLEKQTDSLWAPDNNVLVQHINIPVMHTSNNTNGCIYVYQTLNDRILWDGVNARVVHYETRKKHFWGSTSAWVIANKPVPTSETRFMTLDAMRGGGRKPTGWVSAGRKTVVGGLRKTVYRNEVTAELRVRKMATRSDGSKCIRYIKFT